MGVVLLVAAAVTTRSPSGPEQPRPQAAAAASPGVEEPVELEIPAIDVSVSVRPVGLTADQNLEVPAFGESGWYRPGPLPGQAGYALIAGHIDSRTGPDVFHQLHELELGDQVRVRLSTGTVVGYTVDGVERQPKEALPEGRMWEPTDRPRLALLTCGGRFDAQRHTYPDNLVVYASLT